MLSGKNCAGVASEVDLAVLNTKLDHLLKIIGEQDSTGAGGTGVVGDMARSRAETAKRFAALEAKIATLYSLKQIGVGILITIGGTATLLIAGAKSIVADWLK